MMEIKDYILRYGVVLRKRFREKEKIKFLQALTQDFDALGYAVQVTESEQSFSKNVTQKYYNLYAGDLEASKTVVVSYYDTSAKTFNLTKEYAFDFKKSKATALIKLLPAIFLLIVSVLLYLFLLIPAVQQNNFFSFKSLFSIGLALFLLFLITRYRSGIPNGFNLVHNSSSLIAMLFLAKQLKKKSVAFVFVDGGTTNNYGLKMLDDYLHNKNKKFVYLESIGTSETLQVFGAEKLKKKGLKSEKLFYGVNPSLPNIAQTLYVTSGLVEKDKVLLPNKNTGRDKELDPVILQKNIQAIKQLILAQ